MSDISIADAKNHFPKLVQRAENGEPVRITRRGKPVAVLVSGAQYERLTQPQKDWALFLRDWRAQMVAQKIPFTDADEFENLRDNSERAPVDFS